MGVAKGRALYRWIRTGRSECEVRPTHRAASEGRSALGVFTGVVIHHEPRGGHRVRDPAMSRPNKRR
jgi:hypothetical protein